MACTERHALSAATINARVEGDCVALAATGAWTAEAAATLESLVDETARRYQAARKIDIDLARLERLDTFGAWLIERLTRTLAARGSTARVVGLSDADRGLIEEVRLINRTPRRRGDPDNPVLAMLETTGRAVANIGCRSCSSPSCSAR